MKIDSRTLMVVGSITAIDFLSDVVTYSIGVSKQRHQPIRPHFPAFKEIVKIIAVGAVCGVVIDIVTSGIGKIMTKPEETKLMAVAKVEIEAMKKGEREKQLPEKVIWAPKTA